MGQFAAMRTACHLARDSLKPDLFNKLRAAVLYVMLVPLPVAFAQPQWIEPRVERLPNDLRVVLAPDARLPLVSLQLWLRTDDTRESGSAPVATRMVSELLLLRLRADPELSARGIEPEASVHVDALALHLLVPADRRLPANAADAARCIPSAIDAFAQVLDPSAFTSEELAAARSAIEDERAVAERLSTEVPATVLNALFPEHPYARLKQESPPSAEAMSALLRRITTPANATVVVVGDFHAAHVLPAIRERFRPLRGPPSPSAAYYPSPEPTRLFLTVHTAAGPQFSVHWHIPPAGTFENVLAPALMHRLCNPIDGLVARNPSMPTAQPPRWRVHGFRGGGVLSLEIPLAADTRPAQCDELRNRLTTGIDTALESAAMQPPDPIEWNRARALAAAKVRESRSDFTRLARAVGWYSVVAGSPALIDWTLPRIASATAHDLMALAEQLRQSRRVAVLDEGVATSDARRSESAPTSRKLTAPTANALVTSPFFPGVRPPSETVSRCILGRVRVATLNLRGFDWLEARARILPGPATDHLANQAERSLRTSNFDAGQLRDYLSYHGLRLRVCPRAGGVELRGSGPTAKLPQLLEILGHVVQYTAEQHPGDAIQPPPPAVSLQVVGDLGDNATLETALQTALESWAVRTPHAAPAPNTSQPTTSIDPASQLITLNADRPPRFEICWQGLSTRGVFSEDASQNDLLLRTLVIAARHAAPCPTNLDLVTGHSAHTFSVELRVLHADSDAATKLAKPALALLRALDNLRTGQSNRNALGSALTRARIARTTEMCSVTAIGDAIAGGLDAPWQVHPDVTPTAAAAGIRELLAAGTWRITVPDHRELQAAAQQFLDQLSRSASPRAAPDSP